MYQIPRLIDQVLKKLKLKLDLERNVLRSVDNRDKKGVLHLETQKQNLYRLRQHFRLPFVCEIFRICCALNYVGYFNTDVVFTYLNGS